MKVLYIESEDFAKMFQVLLKGSCQENCIIALSSLNEIVNIEDILEFLVSQRFEQVRRIGQDVKIKVEDSSNENHFENLHF